MRFNLYIDVGSLKYRFYKSDLRGSGEHYEVDYDNLEVKVNDSLSKANYKRAFICALNEIIEREFYLGETNMGSALTRFILDNDLSFIGVNSEKEDIFNRDFKVGSLNYRIKKDIDIIYERDAYGVFNEMRDYIKIHDGLSYRRIVEVIVHELVHAIRFESCLEIEDYDEEENIVKSYSKALFIVLSNNCSEIDYLKRL